MFIDIQNTEYLRSKKYNNSVSSFRLRQKKVQMQASVQTNQLFKKTSKLSHKWKNF